MHAAFHRLALSPSSGRSARRRAQAVVELALVMPITLLIIIGMADFGRAYVLGVAVQQGAREAARLAASGRLSQYGNQAIARRLIDASIPAMQNCSPTSAASQSCTDSFGTTWTITISPSAGTDGSSLTRNSSVTVTASGQMPLLVGFITRYAGISSVRLQGSAQMMVM